VIWTAVAGFGLGGEYGAGQALVSEVVPAKQRGFWSSLLYGGAYIGIFMGALVGGFLLPIIGWRWTFVLSSLPILLALYLRRDVEESALWKENKQNSSTLQFRKKYGFRRFWKPFSIASPATL